MIVLPLQQARVGSERSSPEPRTVGRTKGNVVAIVDGGLAGGWRGTAELTSYLMLQIAKL
jgi:hypothetical protein